MKNQRVKEQERNKEDKVKKETGELKDVKKKIENNK